MLWTINGLKTSKLTLINKIDIDKVGGSKVIVDANVVAKQSKIGFFILKTRFAFAKLSQACSIVPILHYLVPKDHIQIETDIGNYSLVKFSVS